MESEAAANASYFALTATSKNKTLGIFGAPAPQADGTVKPAFHSDTMNHAVRRAAVTLRGDTSPKRKRHAEAVLTLRA